MRDGKAWVGDEIFDEDTQRAGIVTDVSGGRYLLRPTAGGGPEWVSINSDRLTVTVPLDQAAL
ncbi:hypothetical protein OOK29_05740 [Streptomyces phaeochromogenes]|uniref:PRC-barrel domain-containing protein n=1 Tax=Streptomyces phaeochromogenes TaxID=1923 RepID=A0ABZ1HIZ2_STRPH|nr:hypothetical protein [Streptomyces phaeochromogenes]MCX5597638.1 hypothetical protein [Streptomyces phaeochromogenes]WSD18585.1 hypothetical protein OHB35_38110 [Streptomyces phaeochromogenes]